MKRLLALALIALLAGCPATMPPASPVQQVLNTTSTACSSNNAAMAAADAAIKGNMLKGNDADNAIKGFTVIQTGCKATLAALQSAAASAAAASGVSK